MTDTNIDNIVPMSGEVRWLGDSFVNLLAGLGVQGRDKFASQQYTFSKMTTVDLENAYRGDWIAKKVVTIPAWDMTREWRKWQADPDQIELLEEVERKLFIQQKLQQALIKARLYGGAALIIGVDVGKPEDELDIEAVGQDSLQFIHVVSRNQITAGPIIHDITSKYFGEPEFYEARNEPVPKGFDQEKVSGQIGKQHQVRLHPSRVVKLIGTDTADQALSDVWGDSVLDSVNDAVKMCGLVTGSLATLIAELKVDVIKVPELKSLLSTDAGTRKMLSRFSAANVAKSTVNTILIDGNEEWQRIQASLAGVPDVLNTYLQIAAGAADIPATRFLGMSPRGLNATGESDIRNYYDRLAAEQTTILTPAITALDEVLIRSALGDRPETVWYEWRSLWQLSAVDKAAVALQKAQAYKIDVDAAQLPTAALGNARANQLIEDGVYPGLEQALEDAAVEGDTIEEQTKPAPVDPALAANALAAANGEPPPAGGTPQPGFPPKQPAAPAKAAGGNVFPFKPKDGEFEDDDDEDEDDELEDFNPSHDPRSGEFSTGGTGRSPGGKRATGKGAAHASGGKASKAKAAAAERKKKKEARANEKTVATTKNREKPDLKNKSEKQYAKEIAREEKAKEKKLAAAKERVAKKAERLRLKAKAKANKTTYKYKKGRDSQPDLFALEDYLLDKNECHNPAGPGGGQFCGPGGGAGGGGESGAAPHETEPVPGYETGEHAAGSGKEIKPLKEGWYDQNPNKDIPSAIDAAKDAQGRLAEIGPQIAKEHGVTFKDPGIKVDMERIQEKADERGGINRVSDLFRGGFAVDTPQQADAIAKDLAKHYGTANEDWKTTPVGYTDKAVSIRDKNGMVGEVQIGDKAMWHAKADVEKGGLGGHQKYKEGQKLEKKIREGKSTNPEKDRARINELDRQQKDIYGGVLKKYGSDWKKALKL